MDSEDLLFILYTSGSTGKPKGCVDPPPTLPACPALHVSRSHHLRSMNARPIIDHSVAHTTAGYLLYAAMTHKTVFDIQDGDVYACVADCGWITGHSCESSRPPGQLMESQAATFLRTCSSIPYATDIVYGPLVNGATTVLFESVPTYPNHCRYWDLIQRHKVTQFYTAPTAIRALMRFGTEDIAAFDRSSLRVLGSVGEPINPEAWKV